MSALKTRTNPYS